MSAQYEVCPYCKEQIRKGASVCPHCRKEIRPQAQPRESLSQPKKMWEKN